MLAGVEERSARHAVNDVLSRSAGTLGARDVLFFALREATRGVCATASFQRALYRKVHEAGFRIMKSPALEVEMEAPDDRARISIRIETGPLVEGIIGRIRAYRAGARRVERHDDVVGGALVFKGTRIPVATVGMLLKRGVPPAELLADYPSLTDVDLEFARIAVELNPPRGRPRKPLELRRPRADRPVD